jgi:hypothetical protein
VQATHNLEEEQVRRIYYFGIVVLIVGLLLVSCSLPLGSDAGLESTRMALAVQQTSMALEQTRAAQSVTAEETQAVAIQPTYTPYPTYTSQVEAPPPAVDESPTEEPEPAMSFEEWLDDVEILLYDDMYGLGDSPIIENAIDGLGLGSNTKNVGGAMGDFLSNMNSSTQWDLIIVGAESRTSISGEYFDVIADQIDRGSSFIFEVWYIDDIAHGRIQPVMQRCGISFQRDWWRKPNANLNEFLVYLLELDSPMFSEPNAVSMLIPYDTLWVNDVGDLVELNSGSDAVLLAGTQAKEHSSYGLLAECLDGRMVWQLFSTHDYKDQDMINLWQNYIYNTLMARYEYLQ